MKAACQLRLLTTAKTVSRAARVTPASVAEAMPVQSAYAGGFLGPVIMGVALDLAGPDDAMGWALAFGHVAPVALIGLWVLRRLGRIA